LNYTTVPLCDLLPCLYATDTVPLCDQNPRKSLLYKRFVAKQLFTIPPFTTKKRPRISILGDSGSKNQVAMVVMRICNATDTIQSRVDSPLERLCHALGFPLCEIS
jgi:hypothetical protein